MSEDLPSWPCPQGSMAACSKSPSWEDVWTGPCFHGKATFSASTHAQHIHSHVDLHSKTTSRDTQKTTFTRYLVWLTTSLKLPGTLQRGLLWSPRVQDHCSWAGLRVDLALLWKTNKTLHFNLKYFNFHGSKVVINVVKDKQHYKLGWSDALLFCYNRWTHWNWTLMLGVLLHHDM